MMSKRKLARCAVIAVVAVGMATSLASAQEAPDELNLGMLHWIRNTVCLGADEIAFVPVSHDVRIKTDAYAMIDLADPDPDSAHIVTADQRHWLRTNGCDPAKGDHIRMAGAIESADFDF